MRWSDRAVAVGIAQQRDAIGARHTGAGSLHEEAHRPALEALAVLRTRRRIGLGDQHVAIGQHVEPARMIQVLGEGGHLQAAAPASASRRRASPRPERRSPSGTAPRRAVAARDSGPMPADTGSCAWSPHADRPRAAMATIRAQRSAFLMTIILLADRSTGQRARCGRVPGHARAAAQVCSPRHGRPARLRPAAAPLDRPRGQSHICVRSALGPVPGDVLACLASGPRDVPRVHALHPDLGRAVLR